MLGVNISCWHDHDFFRANLADSQITPDNIVLVKTKFMIKGINTD